jgi:hypothetical protein
MVFAPTDLVLPGVLAAALPADLARALADSTAPLLLLPAHDPRMRWVAAPAWEPARWIENAVAEARRLC